MKKNSSHPPHLPHKTCSVSMRTLWSNINNVVLFVFIAVLAGVTGALITSAWIEPTFYSGQDLYFVDRTPQLYGVSQRPDASVEQRFNASILSIFDNTQVVGEGLYPDSAYIGQVAMLSSNGWGVTYMPDFTQLRALRFDMINHRGSKYEIEKTLFDEKTGFVYFKLLGNDFRVMSFPDWELLDSGTEVWSVHDNKWKFRIVGDRELIMKTPFVSNSDISLFNIEPSFSQGGIILTQQGQLLGFADENDILHSAWSIEHDMSYLLGSGELDNFTSTWKGYMVHNNNTDVLDTEPTSGFYITSVGSLPRGLRVGDLILRVDGKKVDEYSLFKRLLSAPQEFSLTVWRKAQEFDIIVAK